MLERMTALENGKTIVNVAAPFVYFWGVQNPLRPFCVVYNAWEIIDFWHPPKIPNPITTRGRGKMASVGIRILGPTSSESTLAKVTNALAYGAMPAPL